MSNLKKTIDQYPIIVSISGASGSIYGFRLLQFLLEHNYSVEFVISQSAIVVAKDELGLMLSENPDELKEQVLSYLKLDNAKAENLNVWNYKDIAASISSGSYKTSGMIIIPCSMGTMGAIASGTSDNLITRAADVCLKEKRRLVVIPREMPLNTIHIENMYKLSKLGVTVAPACPAFYNQPKNLSDSIDFVVGKVLDLFDFDHDLFNRWKKLSYNLQYY